LCIFFAGGGKFGRFFHSYYLRGTFFLRKGGCRIETILIRCLQADDTPYVRAVTRKLMAAAVARIYVPGIKFDSVLVLDGAQGIGKSSRACGSWKSESWRACGRRTLRK